MRRRPHSGFPAGTHKLNVPAASVTELRRAKAALVIPKQDFGKVRCKRGPPRRQINKFRIHRDYRIPLSVQTAISCITLLRQQQDIYAGRSHFLVKVISSSTAHVLGKDRSPLGEYSSAILHGIASCVRLHRFARTPSRRRTNLSRTDGSSTIIAKNYRNVQSGTTNRRKGEPIRSMREILRSWI